MSEKTPPEGSFSEEFQNLGKNLSDALRTAWDHPERKRLQEEIITGLSALGDSLKHEADTFTESPTGQRLKADVQEFGERVRSPEAYEKVRQELLTVLHTANTEIQKVIDRWAGAQANQDTPEEPSPEDPEKGE